MLRRLALLLLLLLPSLASAQDCTTLAAQAGAAEGLPDGLLPAIAMVESGHTDANGTRAPWPWTLNQGGKSMFFDTKAEALDYLQSAVSSGVTNIDVGCMQLNWKWHAAAFSSLDQMFDPVANTRYAARFMRELQSRLGSWEVATAAYHSTDPARGQDYLQKVIAAQGALPPGPQGETTLLASAPIQLDGILAFSGNPLVQLAAAEAAALPDAGGDMADPSADPSAAPAAALIATADAAPPSRPAAHLAPPPDLPLVAAATRSTLFTAENLPLRLRGNWAEIEAMRKILIDTP
ncbi:transglycosylase SLT domain-containing protein [Paragemmobacter straminiformis]|uniref:Transglycosylase SLT domain-containing protein n=1 Tax=Paragemmobacter straminiformis TaxID=2045119 RepID=A0A842I4K1_9RHOB|nr:transglycosylase SLT domain-containing protein [Gemmobacter straminiformis]MBC2834760.1 transglycosylase SLT domain-containing protein [Gemmobacter straminiformis]